MPLQVQRRPGRWTVADIGGTHARLARWSAEAGLETPLRLRNDDYRGPFELLDAWFQRCHDVPRRVVLALAMPIGGDTRQLTNRAWRFESRELIDALRLDTLIIVNDFAAAAAGIDALGPEHILALNPAGTPVRGTRLVLGPGTGLGTAALVADDPPRIVASEAGHITFGSAEGIGVRLNAEGRARWGRVSWERVLSGDGLAWLHAVASGVADDPEAIASAAAAADPRALQTVRLFSRLLGEFAGDVCLAFQAMEGVYLCGGVLRGLLPTFDAQGFLAAFADKGRFSAPLRRVPVYFAAGHELGLQGAGRYLAGQCQMPSMEWYA
ncbi:MAG TPA: glucokinase [Burkholderiaceae bacterium]|nr:glucokinase [Burkholderiaceae bacterium]